MTTDISTLFRSARDAVGAWGQGDVIQALEFLAGSELRMDWEPGDEEWGRIIDSGNRVLAIVCARVPLGIAHHEVDSARLTERVLWMKAHSMSDRVFAVDQRLLEEVFGRQLSDNIDYSRLSINDLWWATVS